MTQSTPAHPPDEPGKAVICSECGRPADDRSLPPIPSLFHWRRMVPVIVLALAVTSLAVWLKSGAVTFMAGSGSFVPRLVEPGITRSDLEAIANGERTDFAFAQAVSEAATPRSGSHLPGEPQLDVGFVSPRGARVISRSMGWPVPWVSLREYHNYDNPVTREGFLPVRTDPNAAAPGPFARPNNPLQIHVRPRMQWRDWKLRFQPAPEDIGGIERTKTLSLPGIAISLGIVIVAWWLTATALFIVSLFRRKQLQGRRIKIAVACVTGAAIILAGLLTRDHSENVTIRVDFDRLVPGGTGTASTLMVRRGFVYPGISPDQLHELLEQPDGDARLARRILEALDDAPPAEPPTPRWVRNEQGVIMMLPDDESNEYLAVVFQDETVMENADLMILNPTLALMQIQSSQYIRRPDFGDSEFVAAPAGWRFEKQHNIAVLRRSLGSADDPTTTYMFDLERNGLIIVALAALWIIAVFICHGIPRWIAKRRRRRGRCVACGYQIQIPS